MLFAWWNTPWRVIARQLYSVSKPVIIFIFAATAIIGAILVAVAISDGVPLSEAIGRLISALPFLLLMQVAIVAGLLVLFGPIVLAIAFFQKNGWRISFEGREYTEIILIGAGITLLLGLLAYSTGKWREFGLQVAHFACYLGAFIWPVYLMSRFRRQQDRILDKIRSRYVLAITVLMASQEAPALQHLRAIRRLEAHWHFGASAPVRIAHIAYAAFTTLGIAFVGQVLGYHVNSHMKPNSFSDTILFLLDTPWLLVLVAGMAVFFSLAGIGHATEVRSKPWGEFYGNQLEAALKAGRGVENAPQHEFPPLPDGVTARELFGLNQQFTKSELRSAWLRLARELHPDRWTSAGQGVRQMKEAALKRVNAARDELTPQAL